MFLALAHMVGATQHHVSCTCTHGRCYATSCFLHLHTWSVLRNIMFLALAHMVGATQHHVSCTCTHGRCYATSCFLALAHMVGATQHHASCTCTHGRCYATSCFLHLHTWPVLRNIMFLALAHMVGATQHHVSLHLHTWSVIRNIMLLALAHMVGATQHHVSLHLHTWSVIRNIMLLALAHMVGATQHHVSCTCTHGWCYATSWGGVGVVWGGDDNVLCTCTHGFVTQHHVSLHLCIFLAFQLHRHSWYVWFLNKAPGLAHIMQALRCHKMKCMSGLVSPTDAFKKPLWQLWLTCSKKKRLTVRLIGPQIHCK